MTTGQLLKPRALELGRQLIYAFPGPLTALAGNLEWYNDTGWALKILYVRFTLRVAGTSTSTVDVNISGTSVFAASGDRPSLASGVKTVKVLPTAPDHTIAPDEPVLVDIDAAGVGAQGLMVTLGVQ